LINEINIREKEKEMTNKINEYAKLAGLPRCKFLKVSNLVLKNWPHRTMQDIAESTDSLYSDLELANPADDTAEEMALFINSLWKAIY
jgi:hypothetical protein